MPHGGEKWAHRLGGRALATEQRSKLFCDMYTHPALYITTAFRTAYDARRATISTYHYPR